MKVLLARCLAAAGAVLLSCAPAGGQDAAGTTPFLFNRPHLSLGGGTLSYHEHNFDLSPGLESHYREPAFEMDFGWDLIFDGHHALALDFDFFQTDRGTERWTEFESLVQTDRLDVGRYGISVGYVG